MPRPKKVVEISRTVSDVDSGLVAVAREYRAILKTKTAEFERISKLQSELDDELNALSEKVGYLDDLVSRKAFNANL